jgi:hypothetical protein
MAKSFVGRSFCSIWEVAIMGLGCHKHFWCREEAHTLFIVSCWSFGFATFQGFFLKTPCRDMDTGPRPFPWLLIGLNVRRLDSTVGIDVITQKTHAIDARLQGYTCWVIAHRALCKVHVSPCIPFLCRVVTQLTLLIERLQAVTP